MKTGAEFIAEVAAVEVAHGELAFWWLGQQSWVVRTAAHTLFFDPYLTPSGRRNTPPLFAPEDMTEADFIFGSHDHADHIDHPSVPGMLDAAPLARLVCARLPAEGLRKSGVDCSRLIALDDGVSVTENGMTITALKAQHEAFDHTDAWGYPHLQFVVETDGVVIHHAGDTLCYDGMQARLSAWDLTISFLPINGRDAERYLRGCLGNMTWQEAVDLAGELGPRLVCPSHYEMFDGNTQDPQPFMAYLAAKYPDQKAWLGKPGECVRVSAG